MDEQALKTVICFELSNFQTLIDFSFQALIKSNDLLKAQLEEIPLEECRYNYTFHQVSSLEHNINDTLLCAKNREKHQDACDGNYYRMQFRT